METAAQSDPDGETSSIRDRFMRGDSTFESAFKELTGTDPDRERLWRIIEMLIEEAEDAADYRALAEAADDPNLDLVPWDQVKRDLGLNK